MLRMNEVSDIVKKPIKVSPEDFELLNNGMHLIRRNARTGEVISHQVGRLYKIICDKKEILCRCTQSSPCALLKVDNDGNYF